jgi:electron transfer flavoprotein beta subunit
MQIYICVKSVPDSAANIAIVDESRIDESIAFLINPYDEQALTEAGKLKEKETDTEVVAVCLGKPDAMETLRAALAMGADRGIIIESDLIHDQIETARILKAAIEQDGKPDLIFTGKESIDSEGMQTMFRLGSLFNMPVATNVTKLDIKDGTAVVESALSNGASNVYQFDMPCVIGAGKGLNTPKYPTFPDVMRSKKKPVKIITLKDLNIERPSSSMKIIKLEPLRQKRTPIELRGNNTELAKKIVDILKDEAKVIS